MKGEQAESLREVYFNVNSSAEDNSKKIGFLCFVSNAGVYILSMSIVGVVLCRCGRVSGGLRPCPMIL